MSIFHYHAVKEDEDDTHVYYGLTHDYTQKEDLFIKLAFNKATGELEEIEFPEKSKVRPSLRKKVLSWLLWKITKCWDEFKVYPNEVWHTA